MLAGLGGDNLLGALVVVLIVVLILGAVRR